MFSGTVLLMSRLASSFRLAGHPGVLTLATLLLFVQVWLHWPSSLAPRQASPEASQGEADPSQVPGAASSDPVFPGFEPPEGATPDYGIQGFHYVSVLKGQKQWQLQANDADFYSRDQWVYARRIKAELFNGDQPGIQVEGQFARYSMVNRNLDVGGQVFAKFPDGSTLQMELLEFKPIQRRMSVPLKYRVLGTGPTTAPARLRFQSFGMEGSLVTGIFELKSQVQMEVQSPRSPATQVWAPFAVYRRMESVLDLYSSSQQNWRSGRDSPDSGARPIPVRLEQGSLRSTANRMEVKLPAQAKKPSFAAWEDVRIEEWKKQDRKGTPDRYSTCGRAEFDPETQEILLTEYPQVYQDGDTMTGEAIRILRKEDQVEVENTNAFTRGN